MSIFQSLFSTSQSNLNCLRILIDVQLSISMFLYVCIQDRDKGLTKIHLSDTVDEMKKFNARRKLKTAVMAAVTSGKWSSCYGDPAVANCDSFSDYGDEEVTTAGECTFF